jgi:hypothetical protein
LKRYKEEEIHSPLWIRDEATKPGEVLASHNILYVDKEVAPIKV